MKQDEREHLKVEIRKALERSGVAGCSQWRRVGDWAALFGVSNKEIQRWIKAGLFPPPQGKLPGVGRIWAGKDIYASLE